MNWSRTKTWLIVLFVGINLFLLFTIINTNISQSTISEQAIQDTVSVLTRNGIQIDPELIPRNMPSLSAVEVLNTMTDATKTAEKLLGGAVTYDAESKQYLRGTAIARIEGDTFKYHNANPGSKRVYKTEQEAIAHAKKFLTNAGFNISKAQCITLKYSRLETKLAFTQKLDSYPLLDSNFLVTVSSVGITDLEGSWFYMAADQSSNSGAHGRIKEVTSILIDFLNDETRAETSTQIVDITLGYTTGNKSTYHKAVSAMPAWCISTSDGKSYLYDAN